MYVPRRTAYSDSKVDEDSGVADLDRNDKKDLEDLQNDVSAAAFLRRESNIDRIEEAAQNYTFKAMKLIVSDNENCLDRDILIHMARMQQKRNYGLLSLPFSIIFFLSYAMCAYLHEDVTNVHVLESGLRMSLGKGAAEIANVKDTWRWLNETILPTIFQQADYQGKPYPDKNQWSYVLSYNKLQGPLFMETQRSLKLPCEDDKSGIADDMLCYPQAELSDASFGPFKSTGADYEATKLSIPAPQDNAYSGATVTAEQQVEWFQSPFKASVPDGRRLRTMRPSYSARLPGGTMAAGILTEDVFRAMFYPNQRYQVIQDRFNYMHQYQWLDKQTTQLTVRAILLNVEVGRPRLQSYKMTLSYSRSGDVFSKLTMDTIFLKFHSSVLSLFSDMAYGFMLFLVTCLESYNLVRAIVDRRFKKHVLTAWFMLQFTLIFLGWIIILGYMYINGMIETVMTDLNDIRDANEQDTPGEINTLGADLHETMGSCAYVSAWHRLLVTLYHLILMIRFFVAFRAQPRLGVVVNTLEVCLLDIFHFAVILVPTFVAYAVSGCFIFGRRAEEFSNIQSSMGVCFKILTETEYDWPYLSEEHFWTTALWTWSFMMFLAILMLNMVLAIVLDVYSEQRKLAGKSESVAGTMRDLWCVLRNWSRWVSVKVLLEKLPQMPRMVTREEIIKEFPGIPDKQAELLISGSQMLAANIHAGPNHLKHTMSMAMAMKFSMDLVADDIEELDLGSYMPATAEADGKKQSWLSEISNELAAQNHAMLMLQWRLQQINWSWQAMDAIHGKGTIFDTANFQPKKPSNKIL